MVVHLSCPGHGEGRRAELRPSCRLEVKTVVRRDEAGLPFHEDLRIANPCRQATLRVEAE